MGERPVRLGWLSLLLTVILICLATLSVLSFATARADRALAEKQAAQVAETYMLERQGQAWLAQMDMLLDMADDVDNAQLPAGTQIEKDGVSAVFTAESGRALHVAMRISLDGVWQVTDWRYTADWAGEAEQEVLLGTQ